MRRNLLWAAVIAAVVLLTAGFVLVVSPPARQFVGIDAVADDPQPIETADLSGSGPGTLVSAVTMPEFDRRLTGSRGARGPGGLPLHRGRHRGADRGVRIGLHAQRSTRRPAAGR